MKFVFTLLLCISALYSHDFITLMLKSKSGDHLQFKGVGYSLFCHPHGVFTISEFMHDPQVPSECKQELQKVSKTIQRRYGTALQNRLHLEQRYHIRSKDGFCVIYFNDNKTYSQVMLEQGLGVIRKEFLSQDRWFQYRLKKAQNLAKREKRGIWSFPFVAECFEALK